MVYILILRLFINHVNFKMLIKLIKIIMNKIKNLLSQFIVINILYWGNSI